MNKIKILFKTGEGKPGKPAPARRIPRQAAVNNYRDEAPQILCDFLSYHETIKAHSQKTVDEYFLDLRNFFRYMKPQLRKMVRMQ